MRRIAVINQKGGVGKTTTTASLGAALGKCGAQALLVDLDPQAHLSLHFGVELGDGEASIYDVLTDSVAARDVSRRVQDNVTLIPSDIDLAGAETELVSVTGREVLLREALGPVVENYDHLLIDCPPSLGILTINALVACEEVIIPLQAHFLALQGLGRLLETVTLVRQRINPKLRVTGIVLCMHEAATRLAGEVVEDLAKFLEAARGTAVPWASAVMYGTAIRRNIKLAESASFGQTVFDYAPRSNGAADYARLTVEIFRDEIGPGAADVLGLSDELPADWAEVGEDQSANGTLSGGNVAPLSEEAVSRSHPSAWADQMSGIRPGNDAGKDDQGATAFSTEPASFDPVHPRPSPGQPPESY